MKYRRIALALLALFVAMTGFPTAGLQAKHSVLCGASLRSQTTIDYPLICPVYVPVTDIGQRLVVGEYLTLGNPCTTDPCLPCLVMAVRAYDTYYYLTMNGNWFWGEDPWDGYAPTEGDRVVVFGVVSKGETISGWTFHNLEVDWLKPARLIYLPLVA